MMCAIAGIFDVPFDGKILEKMQRTMRRRGPDGQGIYAEKNHALLHTRLAIVDPAGGAQPMALQWAGERYILAYNGELYNTAELRGELEGLGHEFRTHSDTEVVLHGCAEWGTAALDRFNGIFAFALWMERAERLLLARDRMGVKPLFFLQKGRGLLFASEIKTILAHPSAQPVLTAEGAGEILLLGPGRTPGSGVFRDIREVEPGCFGVFEKGVLHLHRYWSLKDREHRDSFEDTVAQVRFLVTDAIRRQMVADVPIGMFLSGGLDSSLITAVCAEKLHAEGKAVDTFSVGYADNARYFVPGKFQPNSDEDFIGTMETAVGATAHHTVLTPEDLSAALEAATAARDLPGMADVDFSLLAFCGDIRKSVKMALSGECADEIFGGYPWFRDPEVRAVDGFPWAQNTRYRMTFLHPALREKLDGEAFVQEHYRATIRETDVLPGTDPTERRMKEMVNLNYRWFMQTLLDRKDRMSMYQSLEVRVPFCDYRIAEYLYGVPWAFKDYHGEEKGLLRRAMEGWLPEKILHRKKSPYPKTWHPRYRDLMAERLEALLAEKNAPLFDLVDRKAAEDLLHGESSWPWYGQLMGVPQTMAFLLQTDFWLRNTGVKLEY